jgi:hypothetical protein
MPDDNTSEFIANEMLYQGANSELIPPFVDAGPDIIIGVYDSVSFLSAVANAPSGTIEIIQWEQVSEAGNAIINTASNLQTEVDQLSLDYYTFRITVTDSNGLSAFDEVNVIRVSDSTLTLVETERGGNESDDGMEMTEFFYYEVNLTPDLTGDESVSVTFDMLLDLYSNNYQSATLFALIEIIKNGISIFESIIRQSDMNSSSLTSLIEDSVFSINATDTVTIELTTQAKVVGQIDNEQAQALAKITLKSAVFANAEKQITNLPISEQVRANVFS